ncbi:hypothetical protein PIB30_015448 [Stylosanthes scabra]|uniref:F-box protein n=1 Tax=Stylosanthes scabra TaxID=79078 RepID=A0ABU6U5V0_9FABA|nr:hypothetical protein [Stylosanthes scabra]
MAAEKNCQYLLLLVDSRICGIDLTKLIKPKEAVDWENQPPPPFDLSINLPREYMHVLELDSKIVVLGGYKFRYECNGKLNGNQAVMNGIAPMGCHYNFNRLHSGTKAWECLPSVPDDPFTYFDDIDEYSSPVKEFLLFHFYGMLYIRMRLEDGKVYILTYDTNQPLVDWTMIEGDNDFTRSFCVTVAAQPLFLPPAVAKRVLDNPTQILGRSESSPTQCKFLDSKVLATNMYSMKGINIWSPLFVFPNSQCLEENAQEDPVLGKRKWSKLI